MYPVSVPAEPARRARRERTGLRLDAIQPFAEIPRRVRREAGANLSGKYQVSLGVVKADQQRADPLSCTLGIGEAGDDELLPQHALRLDPEVIASRLVGRR